MYSDHVEPPPPPPTADEAVAAYNAAVKHLDETKQRVEERPRGIRRVLSLRGPRTSELTDDRRYAEMALQNALEDLGEAGVGRDSATWGVLSGAGRLNLEQTLQRLLSPLRASDSGLLYPLLDEIRRARLAAHDGDRSLEGRVEDAVLDLAMTTEDPAHKRRLLDHLPVDRRPVPTSLEELDKRRDHVQMVVTTYDDELVARSYPDPPQIDLAWLSVSNTLEGQGAGTAALVELCRYADAHEFAIAGTVSPGPRFGGNDFRQRHARLRGWYRRHGFDVPEDGRPGVSMYRSPQPVD